jgi:hypothetical protein
MKQWLKGDANELSEKVSVTEYQISCSVLFCTLSVLLSNVSKVMTLALKQLEEQPVPIMGQHYVTANAFNTAS